MRTIGILAMVACSVCSACSSTSYVFVEADAADVGSSETAATSDADAEVASEAGDAVAADTRDPQFECQSASNCGGGFCCASVAQSTSGRKIVTKTFCYPTPCSVATYTDGTHPPSACSASPDCTKPAACCIDESGRGFCGTTC